MWVLNAGTFDFTNNSVPEHFFQDWNLALTGGLALEKGNIRWKLNLDLCLSDAVNIIPAAI